MKPIYRRSLIFIAAILVIAGGYFGYRLYDISLRSVPKEFSEARSQGTIISEKIIVNSNDIATAVAKLGSPTSTYTQTSSTLSEVMAKVSEVHDQAIELAATLETMTKAVHDIRMPEAQQAALQAISKRLNLVSRLTNYTEYINRLAAAIRLRLLTGAQNREDIENLIRQINSEISAANSLSVQADEYMKEFDSLLR